MTGANTEITDQELQVLNDRDFFYIKHRVTEKLTLIMEDVRSGIKEIVNNEDFVWPEGVDTRNGKLSKGESYQQLPYLMLDYPKLFSQSSIFAFRTMFWWGNEFSNTLHLQGEALEKYREKLLKNHQNLHNQGVHICINNSPWEYHFGEDNYRPISTLSDQELEGIIQTKKFIKISRRLSIVRWEFLKEFSMESFKIFLETLRR